jgi:hypothetical protein
LKFFASRRSACTAFVPEAQAAQGGSYTADVKWAGLRGCDAHLIPEVARLPLSPADVEKAHQLLASDFMRATPEYAAEITGMLDRGWKAELEALHAHGLGYITTNFIVCCARAAPLPRSCCISAAHHAVCVRGPGAAPEDPQQGVHLKRICVQERLSHLVRARLPLAVRAHKN